MTLGGHFHHTPFRASVLTMILIQTPVARRRRIPLTPLIDVIFILIMFFLLSSTFGIWRPLSVSLERPVPEAGTQQASSPRGPAVFIVVRTGDRAGLTVNGVELSFGELAAELDRLADLGAETALLVPDKGIDFQRVVHVLDEARASRLKRVSLHLD
ncbi:biopolymer transporter ExbD [Roseibium sp. AS2]|uniref:ExbD/TolR family protein n=1 Tax=Roseibium sp. AS2 TaxID=3135781 RepID=UPI003175EAA7